MNKIKGEIYKKSSDIIKRTRENILKVHILNKK